MHECYTVYDGMSEISYIKGIAAQKFDVILYLASLFCETIPLSEHFSNESTKEYAGRSGALLSPNSPLNLIDLKSNRKSIGFEVYRFV
jgi:hypothetical protein